MSYRKWQFFPVLRLVRTQIFIGSGVALGQVQIIQQSITRKGNEDRRCGGWEDASEKHHQVALLRMGFEDTALPSTGLKGLDLLDLLSCWMAQYNLGTGEILRYNN